MKDYKIEVLGFTTLHNEECVLTYKKDGEIYIQRGYYPVLSAKKIEMNDSDVIELYFESVPLEHNKPKRLL